KKVTVFNDYFTLKFRWSIWTGIEWSVCTEIDGQFRLESGGQFDRFFHNDPENDKIKRIHEYY
ncbi:MAG: hypothetical protein L6Q46_10825, partial [Flavobacterium sp.]|uniref:hypothetical protein n=1 Tax=Flavobacterium sp. TaxID=239 RepID=UPI0025BCD434